MEDVVEYFSRVLINMYFLVQWFSTLGFEVDNNVILTIHSHLQGAITEEALLDLFSEFSKDANAYYIYIIVYLYCLSDCLG